MDTTTSLTHVKALIFVAIALSGISAARGYADSGAYSYFGETVIVTQQNQQALPAIIERFNKQGGTL